MHTGDMVYYDENEFFYIVDRIKQLIKYQSHHVNANQIENVIYSKYSFYISIYITKLLLVELLISKSLSEF